MAWFKRDREKLTSDEKRPVPDGVWLKCDSCGEILYRKELSRNLEVCPKCRYHFRVPAQVFIDLLLDSGSVVEHDQKLHSTDPLEFRDSAKYSDRIVKSMAATGLGDAIRCVSGSLMEQPVELGVMDFSFMGGSVGSAVGEKLARAIDRAIAGGNALVTVSCSGGMRMQEGVFSLMQMAKVSAALVKLSRARKPYISIIANPTTGGTTASFAMLGDVNIAEPRALIGFAGPRVIKQTIGQDLPEGFQTSEFLLEKGFLDMVVERVKLKQTVGTLLGHLMGRS
ncbi:MAG: acetyl-CoA carboxylase carboxyltransferase subunit beta [Calditrichaeota bacterium]|nr:acetyl-CoA carboxylase carboxyltransferase subunit beta [Calditrichota bacterium]